MLRNLAFVVGFAVIQVLCTAASVGQLTSALQRKPKLCLRKQWPRLKRTRQRHLICSTRAEGGFKDRDLYVCCANASDGIVTAHPYVNKGKQMREIKGKKGYSARSRDYAERHRRNDKRGYLLVAAPWHRQAARKDFLLHESRRSDLRRRLLQGITCRALMSAYGT